MRFWNLLWFASLLLLFVPAKAAELASAPTIADALRAPWSHSFGVERHAGQWKVADATSFFTQNSDQLDRCTFDVGNGTTLANMGAGGAIRTLTMYRDGYRAMTPGWPGVWMGKDCATYGSYAFTMDYDDHHVALAGALPNEKPDPKSTVKRWHALRRSWGQWTPASFRGSLRSLKVWSSGSSS